MILYFHPSVFRCVLLRWVRLLGFAVMYGTVILKLYRYCRLQPTALESKGWWSSPEWDTTFPVWFLPSLWIIPVSSVECRSGEKNKKKGKPPRLLISFCLCPSPCFSTFFLPFSLPISFPLFSLSPLLFFFPLPTFPLLLSASHFDTHPFLSILSYLLSSPPLVYFLSVSSSCPLISSRYSRPFLFPFLFHPYLLSPLDLSCPPSPLFLSHLLVSSSLFPSLFLSSHLLPTAFLTSSFPFFSPSLLSQFPPLHSWY